MQYNLLILFVEETISLYVGLEFGIKLHVKLVKSGFYVH